jgi:hypothetical protein
MYFKCIPSSNSLKINDFLHLKFEDIYQKNFEKVLKNLEKI